MANFFKSSSAWTFLKNYPQKEGNESELLNQYMPKYNWQRNTQQNLGLFT